MGPRKIRAIAWSLASWSTVYQTDYVSLPVGITKHVHSFLPRMWPKQFRECMILLLSSLSLPTYLWWGKGGPGALCIDITGSEFTLNIDLRLISFFCCICLSHLNTSNGRLCLNLETGYVWLGICLSPQLSGWDIRSRSSFLHNSRA